MSGVDINYIDTKLSFATYADMSAADVSGIKPGAIAFVREAIGDIDDPDNQDFTTWIYSPTSEAATSSAIRLTGNSTADTAGRWLRTTGAFNITP